MVSNILHMIFMIMSGNSISYYSLSIFLYYLYWNLFSEWLDLGVTRKAIHECDKVLKKQPGLLCAKALKGLALLRLGKPDEADQTVSQVFQFHLCLLKVAVNIY